MGVEVDTNVFVLDITADAAEDLWCWMKTQVRGEARATMIEPTTGKPGFTVKGLGDSPQRTELFDGIPLRVRSSRTPKKSVFDVPT